MVSPFRKKVAVSSMSRREPVARLTVDAASSSRPQLVCSNLKPTRGCSRLLIHSFLPLWKNNNLKTTRTADVMFKSLRIWGSYSSIKVCFSRWEPILMMLINKHTALHNIESIKNNLYGCTMAEHLNIH